MEQRGFRSVHLESSVPACAYRTHYRRVGRDKLTITLEMSAALPVATKLHARTRISTVASVTKNAGLTVPRPSRSDADTWFGVRAFRLHGYFLWYRLLFCIALIAIPGCLYGTIAWSPDGRWLAFVTQSGGEVMLAPGWWASQGPRLDSNTSSNQSITHTLWLSRADTRQCWRLARNTEGLSLPAWSPDGQQIAYVRMNPSTEEKSGCEIVLQRGFEEARVLVSCGLKSMPDRAGGLAEQAKRLSLSTASMTPAWSPRGTFLAAPWLDPPGTAIIRVSDATVVATYPNGYFPSWSPDEHAVALVMPGESEGYHVTSPNFGPAVPAVATKHVVQAAVWEPIGQAFHVIAWREATNAGALPPYTAELVRFDVSKQKTEVVRPVINRRPPAGEDPASIYFARAPGTNSFLVIAPSAGQMTDVHEIKLDRQTPARRHTLLDADLPSGAPSFGLDKDTLAVRFGTPQGMGLPALHDLRSGELRAIVPDHATQVLAVQCIVERILHLFEVATPTDLKNPTVRWIRLPSPAAMTAFALRDSRVADRVERLARFGLGLLENHPDDTPDAQERRALAEAAMFLNYIVADHGSALRSTESLEPMLDTTHDRLALSLVRAQCYMGQRKWSGARELLTLLIQKVGKISADELPDRENEQKRLGRTIQDLLDEIAEGDK